MNWTPGTRVRIKDTCVWPERVGLTATIVAPPEDGTYPQPAGNEVLLLVDDDPFTPDNPEWNCVLGVKDVEPL